MAGLPDWAYELFRVPTAGLVRQNLPAMFAGGVVSPPDAFWLSALATSHHCAYRHWRALPYLEDRAACHFFRS